jgi:hypothetical protein
MDWICKLWGDKEHNLMEKPFGKLPPGRFEDNIKKALRRKVMRI